MYENAARNKDHFDKINKEIAESVGGKSAVVPLKGSARAVEKTLADYDGDPSKIKDLLRTTIEINHPDDVAKWIEIIRYVADFHHCTDRQEDVDSFNERQVITDLLNARIGVK